jgi:hypothetical protein
MQYLKYLVANDGERGWAISARGAAIGGAGERQLGLDARQVHASLGNAPLRERRNK